MCNDRDARLRYVAPCIHVTIPGPNSDTIWWSFSTHFVRLAKCDAGPGLPPNPAEVMNAVAVRSLHTGCTMMWCHRLWNVKKMMLKHWWYRTSGRACWGRGGGGGGGRDRKQERGLFRSADCERGHGRACCRGLFPCIGSGWSLMLPVLTSRWLQARWQWRVWSRVRNPIPGAPTRISAGPRIPPRTLRGPAPAPGRSPRRQVLDTRPPCKAKRQYLLTSQVSRYGLLSLQDRAPPQSAPLFCFSIAARLG